MKKILLFSIFAIGAFLSMPTADATYTVLRDASNLNRGTLSNDRLDNTSTRTITPGLAIRGKISIATGPMTPSAFLDIVQNEDGLDGIRIFSAKGTNSIGSSSTIVFQIANTVGVIKAKIMGVEEGPDGANTQLVFLTGTGTGNEPQPKVWIRASGRLGVGTPDPAEALQVSGNCDITGTLTKGGGTFKIPHPEPGKEDMWLYHGFVESPEFLLIYRGKGQLVGGEYTITLPDYFPHLNSTDPADITVQLTPVGSAGTLYVKTEYADNQIVIGGTGSQKFDWTVYGRRNDPWAHSTTNDLTEGTGKLVIEQPISKDARKIVPEDKWGTKKEMDDAVRKIRDSRMGSEIKK